MLRQKLQADQLQAMKQGDKKRLETIRFIVSQIKNREIDKKEELNDDEVIDTLKKQAKQMQESIDAFEKGGRTDLAEDSKAQLAIVKEYLPAELTDDELKKEIDRLISENKELYEKNPKAMIGICMKELKSKADSARILAILNV